MLGFRPIASLPLADDGQALAGPANLLTNSSLSGAALGPVGSGGALPTNMAYDDNGATGMVCEVWEVGTEGGLAYIDIRLVGSMASETYLLCAFDVGDDNISASGNHTFSVLARVHPGGTTTLDDFHLGCIIIAPEYTQTGSSEITLTTSDQTLSTTISAPSGATNVWCRVVFGSLNAGSHDVIVRIKGAQLETGTARTTWASTGGTTPNLPHPSAPAARRRIVMVVSA